jgi:hypothetical protein
MYGSFRGNGTLLLFDSFSDLGALEHLDSLLDQGAHFWLGSLYEDGALTSSGSLSSLVLSLGRLAQRLRYDHVRTARSVTTVLTPDLARSSTSVPSDNSTRSCGTVRSWLLDSLSIPGAIQTLGSLTRFDTVIVAGSLLHAAHSSSWLVH